MVLNMRMCRSGDSRPSSVQRRRVACIARLPEAARAAAALQNAWEEWNWMPRYLNSSTMERRAVPQVKPTPASVRLAAQRRRPKATTFVLPAFTVSPQESLYACKASSCFCSPSAEVASSTRSSAYSRGGTGLPSCMHGRSMAAASASMVRSMSSTYMPNRLGLSGHPCLTPSRDWKGAVQPVAVLTHIGTSAYRACTACRNQPCKPARCSLTHSRWRGTVS